MTLVVLNPKAGGGRAAAMAAPMAQALQRVPSATLVVAASVQAAREQIAAAARGSRVVVVGGDGSLHPLLSALVAGNHETALVPAGSGDDSARAFGLRGLPWRSALAHALTAPAQVIDLGHVRTEHETGLFVSSLCAGFDAAVAQRALAAPQRLAGLLRYLLATLQEVSQLALHELTVEVDGRVVHEGAALFASSMNTPSYGGGMPAVPGARISDGQLNLLVAGRLNRLHTLSLLPRLLLGRHLSHPEVHMFAFSRALIQARSVIPLAADGEALRPAQRVEVNVVPGALRMVVLAAAQR